MLLSEAVRLGAMLGPQCRGQMFGGNGASCAMGSALLAVGMTAYEKQTSYQAILDKFPAMHPGLPYEIENANDSLLWTREQIADWLVESGNDCSSVEVAPAQEIAAALVSAHMVAK